MTSFWIPPRPNWALGALTRRRSSASGRLASFASPKGEASAFTLGELAPVKPRRTRRGFTRGELAKVKPRRTRQGFTLGELAACLAQAAKTHGFWPSLEINEIDGFRDRRHACGVTKTLDFRAWRAPAISVDFRGFHVNFGKSQANSGPLSAQTGIKGFAYLPMQCLQCR